MCNPETTMGFQYAGAINTGVGSFFEAANKKTAYGASANLADMNAKLSEISAEGALAAGEKEQQRSMIETANLKSAQKTSLAANGIDLSGGGTPQDILNSTDVMGEIDKNTINANHVREALGYRVQGTGFQNEALMDRAAGKGINLFTAGENSLLTGASSISMSRYRMQAAGALPADDWWSRTFGGT